MQTILDELSPRLEAQPTMGILFAKDDVPDTELKTLANRLPYHLECVGGHMSVVVGTGDDVGLGLGTTVGPADGALVGDGVVVRRRRGAAGSKASVLLRESSATA